jgi:hypothetical protein
VEENNSDDILMEAADEYLKRKAGQHYRNGVIDRGTGRLWIPKPNDVLSCCQKIKSPPRSHKYRYTYFDHCKTIRHISVLYDVDYKKLKDMIPKVRMMNYLDGIDYDRDRDEQVRLWKIRKEQMMKNNIEFST